MLKISIEKKRIPSTEQVKELKINNLAQLVDNEKVNIDDVGLTGAYNELISHWKKKLFINV